MEWPVADPRVRPCAQQRIRQAPREERFAHARRALQDQVLLALQNPQIPLPYWPHGIPYPFPRAGLQLLIA